MHFKIKFIALSNMKVFIEPLCFLLDSLSIKIYYDNVRLTEQKFQMATHVNDLFGKQLIMQIKCKYILILMH